MCSTSNGLHSIFKKQIFKLFLWEWLGPGTESAQPELGKNFFSKKSNPSHCLLSIKKDSLIRQVMYEKRSVPKCTQLVEHPVVLGSSARFSGEPHLLGERLDDGAGGHRQDQRGAPGQPARRRLQQPRRLQRPQVQQLRRHRRRSALHRLLGVLWKCLTSMVYLGVCP